MHRLRQYPLALILVLATGLRTLVYISSVGQPRRFLEVDSPSYLYLGRHFGSAFSSHTSYDVFTSTFRLPGYPAFIALAGAHVRVVVLLQVVLSVLSVYLTYRIGRLVAGGRAGLVAAVLVAIDPVAIVYTSQVMTETLFTTTVLAAALAWHWAVQRESRAGYFASALLFAVTALIRPIMLYSVVVLVGFVLVRHLRRRQVSLVLVPAILTGFAIPTGAWLWRNDHLAGGPVFSYVQSENLYHYRAALALAHVRGTNRQIEVVKLDDENRQRFVGQDLYETTKTQSSLAVGILASHPTATAVTTAHGVAGLVAGAPERSLVEQVTPQAPPLLVAGTRNAARIHGIGVFLLAIWGFVVWLRGRRTTPGVLMASLTGYLLALSIGAEAYARFRIPLVPLLAVFAAVALSRLRRHASTGLPEEQQRPLVPS